MISHPSIKDWSSLEGGYRVPYDPSDCLLKLLAGDPEGALNELYENLHHQGDVGTASYASVPTLVECGCLDLVAIIEIARLQNPNPDIPDWLASDYLAALESIEKPGQERDMLGYFILIALASGHQRLALALHLTSIEGTLQEYGYDA